MRGDTLRLRLTRNEVDKIGQGDAVEELTQFPDGTVLRYVLNCGRTHDATQKISDDGTTILIEVPSSEAVAWATSDEVGLGGSGTFQVGPLQILIEKDFACITPREGEEDLDTYPNPSTN